MTRILTILDSAGRHFAVEVPKTRDWYADHVAALDEADRQTRAERLRSKQ